MKSNEKLYMWITRPCFSQLINIGSKSDTCSCIFTNKKINSHPLLLLRIILPMLLLCLYCVLDIE